LPKAGGEYIHHITGVRLRLIGSGSLQMFLRSLDNVRNFTMLPLQMLTTNNIEPTRLANFRSQRTQLEIRVTEMNEYFAISKIVVFTKPSATSYPG
jgi:hypothetical protein